jgi:hypothetical protein
MPLMHEASFKAEEAAKFEVDTAKMEIVVQTIFRKAQNEHIYCKFYADLCKQITTLEMAAKGKKGINDSEFRKLLLVFCRDKFQENFDTAESEEQARAKAEETGKPFDLQEYKEKSLKHKHQLMGNMDFVGELYITNILRDKIAKEILTMLLTKETYTNDTVEAGLRFINRIAPALEKKHETQGDKAKFTKEEYEQILSTFQEIEESTD